MPPGVWVIMPPDVWVIMPPDVWQQTWFSKC
jgi:hypothetical protein